jgi:hypothetical protein
MADGETLSAVCVAALSTLSLASPQRSYARRGVSLGKKVKSDTRLGRPRA